MSNPCRIALFVVVLLWPALVPAAEDERTPTDATSQTTSRDGVDQRVQVTATRLPEDVLDVPSSVTIVSHEELEARGVRDLAGALALVGGVSIAPGGDGGPAASVPELMGLREFDAFLLVVDGVPWGGAFNPALATIDMINVDRIEVMRGSAPVLYGATSFVGVIHVIHRTPVATPRKSSLWGGSYDSYNGAFTSLLTDGEKFSNSLVVSYENVGFRDDFTSFERLHTLWTGYAALGGGEMQIRVDLSGVRQDPASPHPRTGAELSPDVPVDSNYNPSDAAIDTDRVHAAAIYTHRAGGGDWTTTLALSHTARDTVRGFLVEEFDMLPPGTPNALGYTQEFTGDDLYLDSHWAWRNGSTWTLVTGLDVLAGKGEARSALFEYEVPVGGTGEGPPSSTLPVFERPELEDERLFGGAYAQVQWTPAPRWRVDAGLRLNVTDEKQEGEVEVGGIETMATDTHSETRPSGKLGAGFRVWHGDRDALWLFGGYTNAFKPAALDFGPEAEGQLLEPETAETYELGLKGVHLGGRLFWQGWAYLMDFDNLVIAQTVNGLPSLTNAGTQRFQGYEIEGNWRIVESLRLQGSLASRSSKFQDYVAEFDGTPTQVGGNRLEMVPDELASLGLTWYPSHGFFAFGGANYVGERYLNKRNTAVAESYTAVWGGIGYRFHSVELRLDGENLTDERPPVSESELGEAQYYLLPSRRFRVMLDFFL